MILLGKRSDSSLVEMKVCLFCLAKSIYSLQFSEKDKITIKGNNT